MEPNIDTYLQQYTDNPFYQAGIIFIASLVIAKLFNIVISQVVLRITKHTDTDVDDLIIAALQPALFYSIQLIAAAYIINLIMPANGYWPAMIFKTLAIGLWMVFFTRVVKILLRAFSREERTPIINAQTLPLFENVGILLVFAAALYVLFNTWGIDMTAWLASAGIIGIAVGFAAKDTLANLFAGVLIIADAPYKIGDVIVLESGERGEVTRIGIRSTRIQNYDDLEIIIPNAIMGNSTIINESGGPNKKSRIRISVGVAYGSDIDQVKRVLLEEGLNNPEICPEPAPRVRFRQFGASSLDIDLLCWIDSPSERGRIKDLIHTSVYKRFRAEKIEIPYSKQDLYIKEIPERK